MRRLLIAFCLAFTSCFAYSQAKTQVFYNDKEVKLSKDTVNTLISSQSKTFQDSISHLEKSEKHSLYQNTLDTKEKKRLDSIYTIAEQLGTIQDYTNIRKIYSEKAIKAIYDSLGLDRLPNIPHQKISKEDMVDLVNNKFSDHPIIHDKNSMEAGVPDEEELSSKRLTQSAMAELAPITGQVLESKYFTKLDSIRNVNLKEQGLELKEQADSEISKVTEIRQELKFWDKTYFEGIIGISSIQGLLLQLSPALGYHFAENFSLGMGPVIQILEHEKESTLATVGLRPFIKQEFFKRRAYLQGEYIFNPSFGNNESFVFHKHNFMAGGGFLFPISQSVSINICVLYQMKELEKETKSTSGSPWIFRIGISSTKVKK